MFAADMLRWLLFVITYSSVAFMPPLLQRERDTMNINPAIFRAYDIRGVVG